jgi:hypothetical protein
LSRFGKGIAWARTVLLQAALQSVSDLQQPPNAPFHASRLFDIPQACPPTLWRLVEFREAWIIAVANWVKLHLAFTLAFNGATLRLDRACHASALRFRVSGYIQLCLDPVVRFQHGRRLQSGQLAGVRHGSANIRCIGTLFKLGTSRLN